MQTYLEHGCLFHWVISSTWCLHLITVCSTQTNWTVQCNLFLEFQVCLHLETLFLRDIPFPFLPFVFFHWKSNSISTLLSYSVAEPEEDKPSKDETTQSPESKFEYFAPLFLLCCLTLLSAIFWITWFYWIIVKYCVQRTITSCYCAS